MPKVNAKAGDLVYFIEDRQVFSIPIQKVGVQYLYIGIRKRIDIYTMKLDTERSHHKTQYYLTEEEAQKALASMAEVARLGELRTLNEALEKFLGDEDPE